jgi:hypothetical protein
MIFTKLANEILDETEANDERIEEIESILMSPEGYTQKELKELKKEMVGLLEKNKANKEDVMEEIV